MPHKPSALPTKPTIHPTTKSTIHPSAKSPQKHVVVERRALSATAEDSLSLQSGLQFESLIAITSLPIGTTTLETDSRSALVASVDHVLSLPAGSTSYVGDSLFTTHHDKVDGVTLVAHVLTSVSLSTSAEKEKDSSDLFSKLRDELAKSVRSGDLLKTVHSKSSAALSFSFGHSVTSVNMAVFSSGDPVETTSSTEDQFVQYIIGYFRVGVANTFFSSLSMTVAVLSCAILLFALSSILAFPSKIQGKELDIIPVDQKEQKGSTESEKKALVSGEKTSAALK